MHLRKGFKKGLQTEVLLFEGVYNRNRKGASKQAIGSDMWGYERQFRV